MPPAANAIAPMFDAHSPESRAIATLFTETLVVCAIILAVVAGLVGVCVVRFRARPGDAEPRQVHGNRRLEIAWTVIPCMIVTLLLILAARTVTASDPLSERAPDLVIVAHQWWWEARYPSGVVTANEIHIPVGEDLVVRIESADVIHDFWVPQLGRKIDATPGHPVSLRLQAETPGVYAGACAEYCGAEHAWMRISVVAEARADFDAWERKQHQPPAIAIPDGAARGATLFKTRTCVQCHAIRGGVEGPKEYTRVAPDLTHVGSRTTLGAGVLANTPANLALWLKDPQTYKPGSYMPSLRLTDDEASDLVSYLEGLK